MRPLVSLLAFLAFGCSQQPSDLREWRAADHDHTTNPGEGQVQGGPDAGTAPELAAHGLNEVAIVAWQQNCTRCHGSLGRGDGPQGVPLRATDFSNAAWQGAVSDEQILKSIRDGKGAMPAFPLPESTLKPLVQLVRLFGRASAPPASASAAPSGSVPRAMGAPSGRPLPPGHPLPSGHPPLSGTTGTSAPRAPALPPGHPELPAGHPPISATPVAPPPKTSP
ncbi:MAG TPA: cytochrome c [Polyangiaceae bacterium]